MVRTFVINTELADLHMFTVNVYILNTIHYMILWTYSSYQSRDQATFLKIWVSYLKILRDVNVLCTNTHTFQHTTYLPSKCAKVCPSTRATTAHTKMAILYVWSDHWLSELWSYLWPLYTLIGLPRFPCGASLSHSLCRCLFLKRV